MTRARTVAGAAALVTALLLQAALIAPLTMPVPVSLPAVLVAAVALVSGPSTGMSFGFTVGLIADLGSNHPAGVLALSWLGLGVVCGLAADRRSVRGDAAVAAIFCMVATVFATLVLTLVHAGGATVWQAIHDAVPAGLADALLALALVPVVRLFLRTDTLRASRVLVNHLDLGSPRG
jgi:rod shape-determining protein MreD